MSLTKQQKEEGNLLIGEFCRGKIGKNYLSWNAIMPIYVGIKSYFIPGEYFIMQSIDSYSFYIHICKMVDNHPNHSTNISFGNSLKDNSNKSVLEIAFCAIVDFIKSYNNSL